MPAAPHGGARAAPTGDAAVTTVPALDGGDGDDYQRVAMDSEDPHGADNGRAEPPVDPGGSADLCKLVMEWVRQG